MNTRKKHISSSTLDRRQFLKIVATSLLAISGCTNVRDESDLDAAMSELNKRLDEMNDNEQQRVTSIVQRIRARARELAEEHRAFINSFDQLLSKYDTADTELGELTDNYNRNRILKRNDLLHLQDELHAAMTPEDWYDVVRILNQAGKSLAGYTLSGN